MLRRGGYFLEVIPNCSRLTIISSAFKFSFPKISDSGASKRRCPHCNKTKELLGKEEFKDVNILIRDIDNIDEPSGPVLSKTLADMTGQVSMRFAQNSIESYSWRERKRKS